MASKIDSNIKCRLKVVTSVFAFASGRWWVTRQRSDFSSPFMPITHPSTPWSQNSMSGEAPKQLQQSLMPISYSALNIKTMRHPFTFCRPHSLSPKHLILFNQSLQNFAVKLFKLRLWTKQCWSSWLWTDAFQSRPSSLSIPNLENCLQLWSF